MLRCRAGTAIDSPRMPFSKIQKFVLIIGLQISETSLNFSSTPTFTSTERIEADNMLWSSCSVEAGTFDATSVKTLRRRSGR